MHTSWSYIPTGTQYGETTVVDMHCERCFLDLVLGTLILGFKQEFKTQKVDPASNKVVILEDDFSFIKRDVKSPDIFKLPDI